MVATPLRFTSSLTSTESLTALASSTQLTTFKAVSAPILTCVEIAHHQLLQPVTMVSKTALPCPTRSTTSVNSTELLAPIR
jgi:hypothetical protein